MMPGDEFPRRRKPFGVDQEPMDPGQMKPMRPVPPVGQNDNKPGRPGGSAPFFPGGPTGPVDPGLHPRPGAATGGGEGLPAAEPGTLRRRRMGDISDSFPGDTGPTQRPPSIDPSMNQGGPDAGPTTKPWNPERQSMIRNIIAARQPEIQSMMQRRRAELGDQYNAYGPTPTGGDPNAPRPMMRRRRPTFNPYGGGGWDTNRR